ncbi:MAG: CDP-alcohol phosphatidyltransferase family protein [Terriglobales bacterium]
MFRQLLTAPNQLTLLRLIFIPFIIINIVDGSYTWALVLLVGAGISDGLDGLLARALHQQTRLGQYLDPIADKLLLSSLFLVLSILHRIPWKYTVLVFSRDFSIMITAAVLYATTSIRDFKPSIFGKVNTGAQVITLFFVLLFQVEPAPWVYYARKLGLYSTFTFTLISGLHYIYITGQRLRSSDRSRAATPN